jgi:hypothetical protein
MDVEKKKNVSESARNDKVEGLKGKVTIDSKGRKKIVMTHEGKFGQGYDGCGTHTHQ